MPDRVQIYRDASGEYRWRRSSANNRILCVASEGYDTRHHAFSMALRVNRGPYVLEVEDSVDLLIDETGRMRHYTEGEELL